MIENVKERLRAAEYATQCARGHGAFGTTESQMLATFQEHALLDMRYLMDRYTEMGERAEKAERDRDEARAERDARPEITAEDAARVASWMDAAIFDGIGEAIDPPAWAYNARDALRAHAGKVAR